MSKHTLSHASQILAGDGVAFNLALMGDELENSMRGIRLGIMVTELFDPSNVGLAIVSASQTPAAGTADQDLLINGTEAVDGVATLSFCGRVAITSTGVDNGRTFTVLGRDANGRPQAEEITGPNATTVEGIKHFTKVDRIIVDADTAGAITVGQLNTGPRGLRRKTVNFPSSYQSQTHLAIEGNTVEITGSFDGGNSVTQTATNADQRADYTPIALTQEVEVTYLADLTKDGIGENYTDSRQNVPSAL